MSNNALNAAQDMADELTQRLSESFTVGTLKGDHTVSSKLAFIVLTGERSPMPGDVFGTPSDKYITKVVQLVTDADALRSKEILHILIVLVATGARIDWYQSARGTAPTAEAIKGTPVSASPSLYAGTW